LVNKIVEILIVVPHRPVLFSAVAITAGDVAVVVDDVVADRGPVVAGVPGPASEIALRSADQNSAVSVAEHRVVGDGDVCGRMPRVDSPSFVLEDNVVVDVAAQIGVIDAVHSWTRASVVSDVMHPVSDDVVIRRRIARPTPSESAQIKSRS